MLKYFIFNLPLCVALFVHDKIRATSQQDLSNLVTILFCPQGQPEVVLYKWKTVCCCRAWHLLDLKWPYDIAKVGYLIQKFQNQQMTKISHLVSINHEKNRLELVNNERWSVTLIYIQNLFFLFTLWGVDSSSNLVNQIFNHLFVTYKLELMW